MLASNSTLGLVRGSSMASHTSLSISENSPSERSEPGTSNRNVSLSSLAVLRSTTPPIAQRSPFRLRYEHPPPSMLHWCPCLTQCNTALSNTRCCASLLVSLVGSLIPYPSFSCRSFSCRSFSCSPSCHCLNSSIRSSFSSFSSSSASPAFALSSALRRGTKRV